MRLTVRLRAGSVRETVRVRGLFLFMVFPFCRLSVSFENFPSLSDATRAGAIVILVGEESGASLDADEPPVVAIGLELVSWGRTGRVTGSVDCPAENEHREGHDEGTFETGISPVDGNEVWVIVHTKCQRFPDTIRLTWDWVTPNNLATSDCLKPELSAALILGMSSLLSLDPP